MLLWPISLIIVNASAPDCAQTGRISLGSEAIAYRNRDRPSCLKAQCMNPDLWADKNFVGDVYRKAASQLNRSRAGLDVGSRMG